MSFVVGTEVMLRALRRHPVSAILIGFCVAYDALVLVVISAVATLDRQHPRQDAILHMGSGLILFWILVGGWLMLRYRDPIRDFVLRIPWNWKLKFVLSCTLLALTEEVVTVTMTNLAPLFGVPRGSVGITASTNYLDVVCLHSVVVFVPMFVAWAWMLGKWDFHPNAVLLVFGFLGTTAEVAFGGPQQWAGITAWTMVYGLMVYLPAYSIPHDRGARKPPLWAYPFTWLAANVCVAPVALIVGSLHRVHSHIPPP